MPRMVSPVRAFLRFKLFKARRHTHAAPGVGFFARTLLILAVIQVGGDGLSSEDDHYSSIWPERAEGDSTLRPGGIVLVETLNRRVIAIPERAPRPPTKVSMIIATAQMYQGRLVPTACSAERPTIDITKFPRVAPVTTCTREGGVVRRFMSRK